MKNKTRKKGQENCYKVLEPEAAAAKEPPKKQRRGRHPLPEHLEREKTVLEPENLAPCARCGRPKVCMGEELSEELEYMPAQLIVRQTVRPKYACGCGCGGMAIAPLPACLLPQSKLGVGLAVHLLLSRFDDHMAYYTLERIFRERHNVVVPRQQMVQWVDDIAFLLQPLYRLMFEEMKKNHYFQIDETPVKVLDREVKGKCARGYLWFYAVPGGDVFLDFQDTRGRKAPHVQLTGFSGTIQTDAYEVYDSLKKIVPNLVRIGCVAHAQRKFRAAIKGGERRAIPFIIRGPAVGRRRWLFIDYPDAGWRSAVIYSFIISCRRRGINPQTYLTDVLQRLPAMNIAQIAELLPANGKPAPAPTA